MVKPKHTTHITHTPHPVTPRHTTTHHDRTRQNTPTHHNTSTQHNTHTTHHTAALQLVHIDALVKRGTWMDANEEAARKLGEHQNVACGWTVGSIGQQSLQLEEIQLNR